MTLFANSKKQNLSYHCLAVAQVALSLFDKLELVDANPIKTLGIENRNIFKEHIFLSGIFHDWGKIDKNFQNFINNKLITDNDSSVLDGTHYQNDKGKNNDPFNFDNYPRHNEFSWAFTKLLSIVRNQVVGYSVYFHHAKIERSDSKGKIEEWGTQTILNKFLDNENNLEDFKTNSKDFFNKILDVELKIEQSSLVKLIVEEIGKLSLDILGFTNEILPPVFLYQKFTGSQKYHESMDVQEINNLLTRSLIVSADRIVSSWTSDELNDRILNKDWVVISEKQESNLIFSIENMIDTFKINNQNNPENRERDVEQNKVANILANKKEVSVLFGPAGCGKTKIFLEWYYEKNKNLENPQKLYIITPRKMICQSLYNELHRDYIPGASIELITGDKKVLWTGSEEINLSALDKSKYFKANVVILTLDQILAIMLSHKNIDMLLDIINSSVVCDEFHEFFNMPGIVLLFKNIIKMKNMKLNADTLLVSATPNYFFMEDVLKINENNIQYIDTFNKEQFNFIFNIFDKNNEKSALYDKQPIGSIVIFNTAIESQKSSIKVEHENTLNFHSKFTPNDKLEIYKIIVNEFSKKIPYSLKVLRSGPIVQASLNISTMNLMTQICSAENWCQRVGRANRFANNLSMANVSTVLSKDTVLENYNNNGELKFLKKIDSARQSVSWINYLIRGLSTVDFSGLIKRKMTLSDLYKEYANYHKVQATKDAYRDDFEGVLAKSTKLFTNNDFTPVQRFYKPTKKLNVKLSSVSLRGKSVYVLPVIYDLYNKQKKAWLYIPSTTVDNKDTLTLPEDDIFIYPEIINAQVGILSSRKINDFTDVTYTPQKNYMKMKLFKVIKEAKESSAPIILSYLGVSQEENIANQFGLVYLLKGELKVGLYKMSI